MTYFEIEIINYILQTRKLNPMEIELLSCHMW